jgi:hypothetical protein
VTKTMSKECTSERGFFNAKMTNFPENNFKVCIKLFIVIICYLQHHNTDHFSKLK